MICIYVYLSSSRSRHRSRCPRGNPVLIPRSTHHMRPQPSPRYQSNFPHSFRFRKDHYRCRNDILVLDFARSSACVMHCNSSGNMRFIQSSFVCSVIIILATFFSSGHPAAVICFRTRKYIRHSSFRAPPLPSPESRSHPRHQRCF